jgi:nitrite reductase/ring-hydroxylating ferredoxin subunit
MTKEIALCSTADLRDGINPFEREGLRCVVLKNDQGLFAFSALCPHLAGPMDRAEVDKNIVSCPLHGWQFDLDRGGCEINGYRHLQVFEIRDIGGQAVVRFEER